MIEKQLETISLQVIIPRDGVEKILKFSTNLSVAKACREIRQQFYPQDEDGGADHGLLWIASGRWLGQTRVLGFYDFRDGDTIEYKKKHRPMMVKLVDGTLKTILLDESLIVMRLTEEICSHLGLRHTNEYSLAVETHMDKSLASETDQLFRTAHEKVRNEKWLKPNKSLTEQGIKEEEPVLFRKKFFFSDQQLDRDDLVQLSIVYHQSCMSVLRNEYFCSSDEAIKLAALQCQAQFGKHKPDVHKSGFFILEDLLPRRLSKKREFEKKILHEYAKLGDIDELDAQYRYVQLCRSLQYYGTTFFVVIEEHKRSRLHRLLGVSREGLVLLDADSHDLISQWSIYNVRRWTSTPSTLTLDFGDYADKPYIVYTTEGELIAQHISGYIDIIVQKRKLAESMVDDEDAQVMMVGAEEVIPIKAAIISMATGSQATFGQEDLLQKGLFFDHDPWEYVANLGSLSEDSANKLHSCEKLPIVGSQRMIAQAIYVAIRLITLLQTDLDSLVYPNPFSLTTEISEEIQQWKQHTMEPQHDSISSHVAGLLVSVVATIGNLENKDCLNYEDTALHISAIGSNMTQVLSSSKILATLLDSSNVMDELVEASHRVSATTIVYLQSVNDLIYQRITKDQLLGSAHDVSSVCTNFLATIDVSLLVSRNDQQRIIEEACNFAAAVTTLVDSAKDAVSNSKDLDAQTKEQLISLIQSTAADSARIVTAATIMAPTINNPLCQEQLQNNMTAMKRSVDVLVSRCGQTMVNVDDAKALSRIHDSRDILIRSGQALSLSVARLVEGSGLEKVQNEKILDKLAVAEIAAAVAVADLATHDREITSSSDVDVGTLCERAVAAARRMQASVRDSPEMVHQAQILTGTTTEIVNRLKIQAELEPDPEERHRILVAVRDLADATTKVINAAKEATRNPDDQESAEKLHAAVIELENATQLGAVINDRNRVFRKLASSAKGVAAATTQMIGSAKTVAASNRNQQSQIQLVNAAKNVTASMGQLVEGIKKYYHDPENALAQLNLVSACKAAIGPTHALLAASRAALPTVGDFAAQAQLARAGNCTARALYDLKHCTMVAESLSCVLAFECALSVTERLSLEIFQTREKVASDTIVLCVSGQSDELQLHIHALSHTLNSSSNQMTSAALQNDETSTGVATTDVLTALQPLVHDSMTLCTYPQDKQLKLQFLDALEVLMGSTTKLVSCSRFVVHHPPLSVNETPVQLDLDENQIIDEHRKIHLPKAFQKFNEDIGHVLENMPGQYESVESMKTVLKLMQALESGRIEGADAMDPDLVTTQNRLQSAVTNFHLGANRILIASQRDISTSMEAYQNSLREFEQNFKELTMAEISAIHHMKSVNEPHADEIRTHAYNIFRATTTMLETSKKLVAQPHDHERKEEMTIAIHEMIQAAIPLLQSSTMSSVCTHNYECALSTLDNAILRVDSARHAEDLNSVINLAEADQYIYSTCLTHVTEQRKVVIQSLAVSLSHAQNQEAEVMSKEIENVLVPALVDISNHVLIAGYLICTNPITAQEILNEEANALQKMHVFVETSQKFCKNLENPGIIRLLSIQSRTALDANTKLVQLIERNGPAYHEMDLALDRLNVLISQLDTSSVYISCDDSDRLTMMNINYDELRQKLHVTAAQVTKSVHILAAIMPEERSELPLRVNSLDDALSQFVIVVMEITKKAPSKRMREQMVELTKNVLTSTHNVMLTVKATTIDYRTENYLSEVKENIDQFDGYVQDLLSTADFSKDQDEFDSAIQDIQRQVERLQKGDDTDLKSSLETVNDPLTLVQVDMLINGAHLLGQHVSEVFSRFAKGSAMNELRLVGARISDAFTLIVDAVIPIINAQVENSKNEEYFVVKAIANVGESSIHFIEALKIAHRFPEDVYARQNVSTFGRELSTRLSLLVQTAKEGSRAWISCEQASSTINMVISDLFSTTMLASFGQLGKPLIMEVEDEDQQKIFTTHEAALVKQAQLIMKMLVPVMGSNVFLKSHDVPTSHFALGDDHDKNSLVPTTMLEENFPINVEEWTEHIATITNQLIVLKDETKLGAVALTPSDQSTQEKLLSECTEIAQNMYHYSDAVMKLVQKGNKAVANAVLVNSAIMLSSSSLHEIETGTGISSSLSASVGNAPLKIIQDRAQELHVVLNGFVKSVHRINERQIRVRLAVENSLHVISTVTDSKHVELWHESVSETAPADVIYLAKQISANSAHLVSCSSSTVPENEFLDAVKNYTRNVELLSFACRNVASLMNASPEQREQLGRALSRLGLACNVLLGTLPEYRESTDSRQDRVKIMEFAKIVSERCAQLVDTLNSFVPGGFIGTSSGIYSDRELLTAASSIEQAIQALGRLLPSQSERLYGANKAVDGPLLQGFEAGIVEAVHALAAAMSALIVTSTAAQSEISASESAREIAPTKMYYSDGTWAEGLVSAARAVANSTRELCSSTAAAAQGQAEYERVVVAGKGVFADTAHLLAAATVKLDPISQARDQLSLAGRKIKEGTEQLIRYAQDAALRRDQAGENELKKLMESIESCQHGTIGLKRMEMEAQTTILKLEKELEKAREKLALIRKSRYQPLG